jgi:hypothetical protein
LIREESGAYEAYFPTDLKRKNKENSETILTNSKRRPVENLVRFANKPIPKHRSTRRGKQEEYERLSGYETATKVLLE